VSASPEEESGTSGSISDSTIPGSTIPAIPDGSIAATISDDDEPAGAPALTWADLGTDPRIIEALTTVGITAPFPIQAMTLPVAFEGHDIIGQAKTGTGKTLGFGIPLLHRVAGPGEEGFDALASPGAPQALVIVPTRELAGQVADDLRTAGARRSCRVLTVYGGRAYEPQIEALGQGIEVVVGTPGRLLDLAQQGRLTLGEVRTLVLDEADEMLDLGFLPDVEKLLSLTPDGRQTMLFSATMPGAVVNLARRYMTQPTHIRASDPTDTGATVLATMQFVYRAHAMDKVEMLARLLQARDRGLTIIFARTKRTAAKVADELLDRGFAAAAIHGDLGQGAREQALRAFRKGKVDVLVATDVAARGIDVENVTHVVNYGCPEDEKAYLHRIGRTGRAGHTGVAVTFVDWDDLHRWTMIDKALDLGIPNPVETYSTSAHFFADLHIPEGTRGTLPRAARTRAGLDAEAVEDLGETGKHASAPHGGGRRGAGRSRSADSAPSPRSSDEPRRTRQRRRTRGGVPIEQRPSAEVSAGSARTAVTFGEPDGANSAPADGENAGAATRRRRRRGGRGRGGAATSTPAGDTTE
jgi:superfamily II DNA/RNA helicase